jgi:hypothetical protein
MGTDDERVQSHKVAEKRKDKKKRKKRANEGQARYSPSAAIEEMEWEDNLDGIDGMFREKEKPADLPPSSQEDEGVSGTAGNQSVSPNSSDNEEEAPKGNEDSSSSSETSEKDEEESDKEEEKKENEGAAKQSLQERTQLFLDKAHTAKRR